MTLLLNPLLWILALLALLLALLLRRRGAAGRTPILVCLAAIVVFYLISSPVLSSILLETLESRHPPLTRRLDPPPEAIVVLGAGLGAWNTPRPELSGAGRARLLEGLRLAAEYRGARIVLSGGVGLPPRPTSAHVMAAWARRLGVDAERLVLEPRAQTTRGNAVETAALARQRGWTRLVVVTSAAHMPRALASFRAVGLDPVPAPCDFSELGRASVGWILPEAEALPGTARFLHEVVGRIWYRLRGWA
jgi:uncharacterized SAM-binding protein YcdF (DUF218 family)